MSPLFFCGNCHFLKEANYEQRQKHEIVSLGEESLSDNILRLRDVQLPRRSTDNGTLIISPQPYIPGLLHRDQVVCSSDIQRTLN